jgi:hypothetical protein
MVAEEKRELKEGLEVIKEIIESQPVGKEIEITVYDISKFVPLIKIKGDKVYSLVSFEDSSRLSIDDDTISNDIKPILGNIVFDIRDFIRDNIERLEIARECYRKGGIFRFIIKKK